jgi:dihydropteroate synthase
MTTFASPARLPATRIGPTTFAWGTRTFVMGIVNVTPDSFSGDGLLASADPVAAAVVQARAMVDEGADLLDIGGESTRPGHESVQPDEEVARVVPVVAAIRAVLPATPLSIDTTKAVVAEAALAAGANLLNDVWGTDPASPMAALAANHGVPLIVMHQRAEARYDDVVADVLADLRAAVDRARAAGIPAADILVDPGIGFGKTADHNVTLLHDLARLRELGQPVLLGTSRKSTIGRILDLPAEDRLEGTLATTALGVAAAVDIVRVHDVRANVRAARVSDAIVRGTWRATEDSR